MVRCELCNRPIDPTSTQVWRRVVGWERKATAQTRKAGSDIALREPRNEYAHAGCIHLRKAGIDPTQEQLL